MSGQAAAASDTSLEAGGNIKGVALARVTNNKDPDGLGRVKLRFLWHEKPSESDWVRIALIGGNDRGIAFLPEVDDEVLVAFERGDMRFPYVLGGLWNGKDKPPYANSNGKNDIRMVKTRKGHTLLFDDNSAKGRIELKLSDGKKLEIDDDGIRLDDGNGNSLCIDSRGRSMTVQAKSKLTLKAASISIEASGSLSVKSNAVLKINGQIVQIN
jgi:uncharacterized protein involved in type VI secretion and phage assembly